MRILAAFMVAVSITLLSHTDAIAYSETPFVNAKKGDTKTHRGWVIRTGDESYPFLVVVTLGCNSGHTAFYATAGKDVVSNDQLGRPVLITATVVEKISIPSKPTHIRLKILKVNDIAKAVAAQPAAKAADIKCDVSITFSKPEYRFTLAEAAKGISIKYDVVVKRDVPNIIALPQDDGGCFRPDASGLIAFEKLLGNGQRYGIFDIGLCPPIERKPATVRKGSYPHKFSWDGRNWGGGSDTSRPKGKPFPPGTYTLDVSLKGQTVKKDKRELFHITKQVKVTLVE